MARLRATSKTAAAEAADAKRDAVTAKRSAEEATKAKKDAELATKKATSEAAEAKKDAEQLRAALARAAVGIYFFMLILALNISLI